MFWPHFGQDALRRPAMQVPVDLADPSEAPFVRL